MSQKQQIIPTDKRSQGFKGRGLGNNNNNRSSQSQGRGNKSETPKVNTYTGNSIRTQEQKRKTVFKAVLDSPFNIGWPEVSIKDQNEILDALCETLSIIKKPSKKRNKKIKTLDKAIKVESNDDEFSKDDISSNKLENISSIRSSNICFGINEVTKHLERMTNPHSHSLISVNPNYQLSNSLMNYHLLEMVFVCKADLLPQLYSHFPTICNIAGDVLLVPLPSGASKRISDVVNFKRVSCIGVKINAQEFTKIYKMVKEKVKPVNVPWLNPLKPPEIILNERKVLKEEQVKKEKVEENFTHSLSSNKRKQVEMIYDDEPKIKVEVASSSHTESSPSIFLFGQQPQVKIEPTSTQLKPTSFDYVPTRIKQLITTAPINKDQAREKRREKKLKYRQKKK
ncbi:hypothetical protein RhiirA4_391271 [Rhizophagus irregularis]|uniref:Uncharacterized protein n=1 Tax=Rhizophagus irregularis TaxID=588596 RepID=A0A2I1FU89_9GLOM|nr:hypothetical protein RhiirA4_391271 [Rhizophagus irregularis]